MVTAVLTVSSAEAGAQAWITPPGESTFSVMHQYVRSDVHLNKEGLGTRALGTEVFHVVAVEGTFGVVDRVAVEAGGVWLATRWTGPERERHGPLDTGAYHAAVQDLRFVLRYQLATGATAVAPFLAVSIPSHDYETRGHSAFGRRLRELETGLSVGRRVAGHGYVQAGISYAWSEQVDGVDLDLDHVNGDIEVGHPAWPGVHLKGFARWQLMWDGLELGPLTEHIELSPVHDRFARASYLQLGGGASIALGQRTTLSISAFATAGGRNVHAVHALVTGISWRFGGGFRVLPVQPPAVTTSRPSFPWSRRGG